VHFVLWDQRIFGAHLQNVQLIFGKTPKLDKIVGSTCRFCRSYPEKDASG
jgi:hypothetical protein